jgi:hypothetical protein
MRCYVVLCVALAWFVAGCDPIRTSAVSTKSAQAWQGRVFVVAYSPADEEIEEVGVVQAVGINQELPELVHRFSEKVASIGGNIGVVDSVRTRYELVTRTESYQYSCGDSKSYRTCTGTRTVTHEQATTTVIGRAFRK